MFLHLTLVVVLLQLIRGGLPGISRGDARINRHPLGCTVIIEIRLRRCHRNDANFF